jgi:hypothetical protein
MTRGDSTTPLDDDFIDRIVDGALTPAELGAAVDRLDREPDGWKRCALAFLEAQCWREAFRALDEPAGASPGIAPRPVAADSGRSGRSHASWRQPVLAAGLAAASFVMGWLVHSARPAASAGGATPPPTVAVAPGPDHPEPPPGTPGVVDPSRPADVLAGPPRDDGSPPNRGEAVVAVARLRVGPDGDSAEVPILAGPGIDEEWLWDRPPPLTEHVEALWRRRGYQVDQRRHLLTATLADGRLVTVPVDEVELRYTGNDPL